MKLKILFLLTALAILLVSCSSGLYNRGKQDFDAGNYEDAILTFKKAAAVNPEKAANWRFLGMAYYHNEQYAEATDALKQASILDPDDGTSVLYLGMSYERMGMLRDAAELYRTYLDKNPDGKIADRVRHRARYLTDKVVQDEVQQLIADEKAIDTETLPDNTVAVVGFNPGNLSTRYAPLARGLSELLVIDLSKVPELTLVERLKLQAILDELELTRSEYFDKDKVPRVGKLVGAGRLVSGQLSQPQQNELKLESGIIAVKDGFVDYPADVEGDLNQFFALQDSLAANILRSMGIPITEEIKQKLAERPTESFLAFLSYSLGLEYMDQGMFSLAEAQFENALKEDPNFQMAREAQGQVEGLSDYTGQVEPASQFERDVRTTVLSQTIGIEGGQNLKDLQNTLGFQPDVTTEDADDPYTEPVVGTGKVTVTGNMDEQ